MALQKTTQHIYIACSHKKAANKTERTCNKSYSLPATNFVMDSAKCKKSYSVLPNGVMDGRKSTLTISEQRLIGIVNDEDVNMESCEKKALTINEKKLITALYK